MSIIFLIIGFILLIKGADFFVDGASNIAVKMSIPPILVGLTIVSMGTSAPEAAISIMAALDHRADMVLGNIVGSNIFNIAMTLGIAAILVPLVVKKDTVNKDIPITLFVSIILLIMMVAFTGTNDISRLDGIILLAMFVLFLVYIWMMARAGKDTDTQVEVDTNEPWLKNIVFTVGGVIGIIVGGDLVVRGASEIALNLGMSEALVGLTIVAIGTSLPELVTSVAAVLKGELDIAIGNVVGSNLFNILFVAGITGSIAPITVDPSLFLDVWVMIGLTILLFAFAKFFPKINRTHGIIFVLIYIVYTIYIIIRN